MRKAPPYGGAAGVGRNRRAESDSRSALALIGSCILVVILIPVALDNGWFKHKVAVDKAVPDISQPDLVLVEESFDPASRTVRGVIFNNSGTAYKNVAVSYKLKTARQMEIGAVLARIPSVAAHGRASFRTDPMPADAAIHELREIAGMPDK